MPDLRVLTLTQPWATLVAIGAKTIETRSWRTPYRGRIAIHAAQAFPRWARALAADEPFRSVLEAADIDELPRGAVVAIATLSSIERIPDDTTAPLPVAIEARLDRNRYEGAFGDYSTGRYGWLLDDVLALPEPVPARGALGLRPAPEDLARELLIGGAR